jgi:hypothetical protein
MAAAAIGGTKKRTTAKPLNKTIKVKVGGVEKRFTKVGCSRLKKDATKKADKLKEQGFTVRVKKDPVTGAICIFKGAKRKTTAKKTEKKK